MGRFVMVGNGVDAGLVTAIQQRAQEQVPRAARQIVISEFRDRKPPISAVVFAVRNTLTGSVRPVLTLQLHGGHQPVQCRVRAPDETTTANAQRKVLGTRRTAHVSFRA